MRPAPARFPILRPPPLRAMVVVALAIVVGAIVHRTTAGAAEVTRRLGETAPVAVVARAVSAGESIEAGDVHIENRPLAHVPDGAVADDPTGATVRQPLHPGEVLVADRLAGGDRSGPAALVPEGWRALAVPIVDAPVPAAPGALVDVIASFDPTIVARDPSVVVAADAVVVEVTDDAVTVAVPRSRATDLAFALANGIVTLALVG